MTKEKICGIYCIENKVNGKKYIGQSIDIYNRWKKHLQNANRGINTILYNAIRKYGKDSFKFYIVQKCDRNELSELEIKYISEYNTKSPCGYNMTDGGEGTIGYVFTDEDKRKISEAGKGRIGVRMFGEDNPMFGLTHSDKTKELIRQKALGRKASEETRRKLSKASKGRKHSDESKQKMSEWQYKTILCDGLKFKGIESCAKHYNVNPRTMKGWLNQTNKMPVSFYLRSLHYEDIELSEYSVKKFYFCNNIIFDSIYQISDYCSLPYASIQNMLLGVTQENELFKKYNIHIGKKEELDELIHKNIQAVLYVS